MPKQIDHTAYRQALIDQCVSLFAETGFTALTMRKIASALSVSTGTLYHYFPNKEALFMGVVREVSDRDLLAVETAVPIDLDPEQKARGILMFMEAQEGWLIQQHHVLHEYIRTKSPEAVRTDEAMRKAAKLYHERVAQFLGVSENAAKTILYFLKGLLLQRFFDGGITSFEEAHSYLVVLLKHGQEMS